MLPLCPKHRNIGACRTQGHGEHSVRRKAPRKQRLTKRGKRLIAALSEVLEDVAGRKVLPVVAGAVTTDTRP
jgi:hypothetical protein